MTDPKGSADLPETAGKMPAADAVEPVSKRDPILEELLRSKSDDDAPEAAVKKTKRKKKGPQTGTSLDKKSRKSKLPLVAGILAGVLILGGGGYGLWSLFGPTAEAGEESGNSKTQAAGTKKASPEDEVDAVWNNEETIFPIKLEDWQTKSGTEGISPEEEALLVAGLLGSDLSVSSSILPSEAAGFTSDDSKILNEDGSVNSLYSYWTQEAFLGSAGQAIERFLNPRFGAWEEYQGRGKDPNSIEPATLFPNTFTSDLLGSGKPVNEWLPIYADWDNDGYGRGDLAATGARWYGEIESSQSEFVWDESTSQYVVNFTANVKFTAYKTNGEKATEKGVLTLEFVANPGGVKGSGGKVLVNGSSLTIGG